MKRARTTSQSTETLPVRAGWTAGACRQRLCRGTKSEQKKSNHKKGLKLMRMKLFVLVVCVTGALAVAAERADFSGSWEINQGNSKNLGMMAQMKIVLAVKQSDTALDVTTTSTYQGKDQDSHAHYDLTGSPTTNESPMGGPAETVAKWTGDKLVNTWTSQSAVAGQKVVRTETWSLSSDGKVLTVESVRGSNTPVVFVYDKKP